MDPVVLTLSLATDKNVGEVNSDRSPNVQSSNGSDCSRRQVKVRRAGARQRGRQRKCVQRKVRMNAQGRRNPI
jgi:hypothetical protein